MILTKVKTVFHTDFDICDNCYNDKDAEIRLDPDRHQSTHPVIRYIYAPTGILLQRQRTNATKVLKELLDAMEGEPPSDNEGIIDGMVTKNGAESCC